MGRPGHADSATWSPSRSGSAWATRAPHGDTAHGLPESEAKITGSISECLRESPTPPDKHLSGDSGRGNSLGKNKRFVFSPWLLEVVSKNGLGRQRLALWLRVGGASLAEP